MTKNQILRLFNKHKPVIIECLKELGIEVKVSDVETKKVTSLDERLKIARANSAKAKKESKETKLVKETEAKEEVSEETSTETSTATENPNKEVDFLTTRQWKALNTNDKKLYIKVPTKGYKLK